MTSHASRLAVSCLAIVLCAVPVLSSAQTLADVARASAARRKEQPKAGKVYTNGNLKSDITPSAPSAPVTPADGATAAAPAASGTAAGATPPSGSVTDAPDTRAKEEATWRARMADARAAVDRSMAFASALQSQINALTTDFINRDDPAQRGQIEQQRLKAVAELERTQREIEANRKAVAGIEEEARKAGVPAGWLR